MSSVLAFVFHLSRKKSYEICYMVFSFYYFDLVYTGLSLPSVINPKAASTKKRQREALGCFTSVKAVVTLGVATSWNFGSLSTFAHAVEEALWPTCWRLVKLFILFFLSYSLSVLSELSWYWDYDVLFQCILYLCDWHVFLVYVIKDKDTEFH